MLHAEPTHSQGEGLSGVQTQQLFEELMLSKQHLIRLFDVGPRSNQEKTEVEGGGSPMVLMHYYTDRAFFSVVMHNYTLILPQFFVA